MSEIEIFSYEGMIDVRVVEVDGEPWFVAADVCDALGLVNVTRSLDKLDDDETTLQGLKGADGQVRPTNLINEPGLYSLILRSNKPEAKRFKRWITHEVLPTIRQTGGAYIAPGSQAELDLTNPDTALDKLIEVAQVAKQLRAKNIELEQKIEEQAPKVLVADEFFDSEGLMGLRETARSFGIPERWFTNLLRQWNWIDTHGTAAKNP